MNIYSTLILLFSVLLCNCKRRYSGPKCGKRNGLDSRVPYIMGGRQISHGRYPWLVNLRLRKSTDLIRCAGTMITKKLLVTSAHCLYSSNRKRLKRSDLWVYFWTHDIRRKNRDEMRVPVRKIFFNPDYRHNRRSYRNDIAMVEISFRLSRVDPICIPCISSEFGKFEPRVNERCMAVGWGKTSHGSDYSRFPMESLIPVVDRKICNSRAYWRNHVSSKMLCAGSHKQATCTGDSGGPLMCERDGKWYLSGVVSWGPILCGKKPSVFTNVAEYSNWIGNIVMFRDKNSYCNSKSWSRRDILTAPRRTISSSSWNWISNNKDDDMPLPCDATSFERRSQLYFMGTFTKKNFNSKNVATAEECTFQCCLNEQCNSVLFYPDFKECNLFTNRFCDVFPDQVDRNYKEYNIIYYGKPGC